MWLVLGCAAPHPGYTDRLPETGGPGDTHLGDTSATAPAPRLDLATPRLPYAEVGDPPPTTRFLVTNVGEVGGALSATISGEFTVTGADLDLGPGGSAELSLTWGGSMAAPALGTGELVLALDGDTRRVPLSAVIGDPAIPPATWTTDAWGELTTLDLPSAPFAYAGAPYPDASVRIFLPSGWEGGDALDIVTHFHGHNATLAEVDETQFLHVQHALSGRNAVLVLPQGPVEAADSDFGQLDEPGGHGALLRDVVSVLYREGRADTAALGAQVLAAHSGGYSVTANVVEGGGIPVDAVHLFDALYAREDTYAAFAAAGGRLRSVYTSAGGTDDENRALARTLSDVEGLEVCTTFTEAELARCAVAIGASDASHDGCVRQERAWARWLRHSGLPPRPTAAPTLQSVLSDGAEARVRWREDGGIAVAVEGSADGERWEELGVTDGVELTVPASPWIRVRQPGGDPSDAYPGDGAEVLVVDGFDRVIGGSWSEATHPLAARLAGGLGGASGAWHEAVAEGEVELSDWPLVVWMLGDEGVDDLTFDAREQDAITRYLEQGGRLVVSGAEVGYATDAGWLSDTLHAGFVADDAATTGVEGWSFGAAYPEDYPDVLDGDEVIWRYSTGAAAAVGWEGRVVVVGFGLENLADDDLAPAFAGLLAWFGRARGA